MLLGHIAFAIPGDASGLDLDSMVRCDNSFNVFFYCRYDTAVGQTLITSDVLRVSQLIFFYVRACEWSVSEARCDLQIIGEAGGCSAKHGVERGLRIVVLWYFLWPRRSRVRSARDVFNSSFANYVGDP